MREEPEEGLWLTANWYQVRDDWRAVFDSLLIAQNSRAAFHS